MMDRLRSKLNKLIKDESGNVLILVTFLLILILFGMAALSVDAGNLYLQRRDQQNTADAAALAAAWELPGPESTVRTVAMQYVAVNDEDINEGDENNNVVVTVFDRNRKVRVEITKEHSLYFALAPPIGQTEADVYATAVATRAMPGMDILPFMVLDYDERAGQYEAIIGDEFRYYPDSDGNINYDDPYYDVDYNRIDPDRPLDGYEDYENWADNNRHFHNLMNDHIVPVEIYSWILGPQSGNFGLVDVGDFSDSDHVTSGNINAQGIRYVLENGLDTPFCTDDNNLERSGRPGYINAIETSGAVGISLSECLERGEEDGFYIILPTPKKASEIQGNRPDDSSFGLDDFIVGYVQPLELTNDRNLNGIIREVIICEDLDPSSWHSRVMLIE